MLDLAQIPFFAVLSADDLDAVRDLAEVRRFGPGAVICRRGEPGRAFYAIASGGVTVAVSSGRGVKRGKWLLGPGEVFGEMSLISDMPVAAMVVAAEETSTYVLPKDAFLRALEAHVSLRASLAEMLVSRMRQQPRAEAWAPACVVLELSADSPGLRELADVIVRGVRHYAPGSSVVDTTVEDAGSDDDGWASRIESWRGKSARQQFLVVVVGETGGAGVRRHLHGGDAVLRLQESSSTSAPCQADGRHDLSDQGVVVLQTAEN